MKEEQENTYDFICFGNLVYEFDFDDKKETERKIKRRLKYYKLGEYDQERVDYIRELKNELYSEIRKETKSLYFNKSNSNFADYEDFNFEGMLTDYSNKYILISKSDLGRMINFAIYLYHLR